MFKLTYNSFWTVWFRYALCCTQSAWRANYATSTVIVMMMVMMLIRWWWCMRRRFRILGGRISADGRWPLKLAWVDSRKTKLSIHCVSLISLCLVIILVRNKIQSKTAGFAHDTIIWQTRRNIRVVFDSGPFAPLCENMTSSTTGSI